MENKICEDTTQDFLDINCRSVPPVENNSSASVPIQSEKVVQNSLNNLSFPTPEKTIQPTRNRSKEFTLPLITVEQNERNSTEDEAVKLPDKYKIIAELFDRIGTSVRLLSLRKKLQSFQNICTQVEVFTKRKLSYTHLAQIKYILPEVVQIEKVLVHDEKTLCMKPDIKVTLQLDVIETHPNQSPFMVLRQVFLSRLLTFLKNHPESPNIPEATLPVLFSQMNQFEFQELLPEGLCMESRPSSDEPEPSSNSSHLSSSFSRRFSQRIIVLETEKTNLLASPHPRLPLKCGDEMNQDRRNDCESSPMKSVFGINQLMIETPTQPTPQRRSLPRSGDKVISESKGSSHLVAKRSLNFLSPLKGDGSAFRNIPDDSKQCRDNNPKTADTKRVLVMDDVTTSSLLVQTVEEENTDSKMSKIVLTKRQQMIVSLPNLFNLIRCIFQSANYSSITKQELIYKIISEDIWIDETREAEERLDLLEELVPDWIQKKLEPSGDLLYSIRKVSDLDSISSRLVGAV